MEIGPRELGRVASKGSVRPRSRRDPQVTETWEGSGNVEETRKIKMESKEDSGWNHTGLGTAAAIGVAPACCHGDERRHQHEKRRHDVP